MSQHQMHSGMLVLSNCWWWVTQMTCIANVILLQGVLLLRIVNGHFSQVCFLPDRSGNAESRSPPGSIICLFQGNIFLQQSLSQIALEFRHQRKIRHPVITIKCSIAIPGKQDITTTKTHSRSRNHPIFQAEWATSIAEGQVMVGHVEILEDQQFQRQACPSSVGCEGTVVSSICTSSIE